MEVVFIGTGGGRINLIKQVRGTGGFRINGPPNIHVDPGPGALTNGLRRRQSPLKLDAIIVTHNHIDHSNDAEVIIEGMTGYGLRHRGVFIGSKCTIECDKAGDRAVSLYHQQMPAEVYLGKAGKKRTFETRNGEFTLECIRAAHDTPDAFGFKLTIDGKVIGYTTDTEYYDGIEKNYSGCDLLIINVMKPAEDKYKGHMTSEEVERLIKEAKPKLAVLTHFGMKMMWGTAEKVAKEITKNTGVKTVAAADGKRLGEDSF